MCVTGWLLVGGITSHVVITLPRERRNTWLISLTSHKNERDSEATSISHPTTLSHGENFPSGLVRYAYRRGSSTVILLGWERHQYVRCDTEYDTRLVVVAAGRHHNNNGLT